jgi:hypothetical protein
MRRSMERTSGTVVAAALCEERMIRPYYNSTILTSISELDQIHCAFC